MKPEIAKQLQDISDSREQQKQAAITQASEQQKAQANNLADFAAKKEEVIKPAFQEIVDLYKARGVAIRTVEEDERPNDKGGTQSPNIRLDMAGAYSSRSDMKPEFRLTLDKRNRTLSLYTATQSRSGPDGNVSLDAITAEWIQSAFLKYASGSFR